MRVNESSICATKSLMAARFKKRVEIVVTYVISESARQASQPLSTTLRQVSSITQLQYYEITITKLETDESDDSAASLHVRVLWPSLPHTLQHRIFVRNSLAPLPF